ncbi:hypothetical protein [Saccharospirillum salsuginis]|uniref:Uncharacterized protein n=1 Tax=Saccharospirillum salsuginis TaxID=418750 RepID=A0A918NJ57_9GAMM|nr:hypothetical protein [Saccharospirillum salsuginis]GGX71147.1 hypothetical protein GCM10007392_43280 [Saccharospirillum salsuginis]
MSIAFRRLSTLAATFALAGCVTNGMDAELTRCTFPDSSRTPAPAFICGETVDGFHLTRLTSVPPSDTTSTQDRIETGRLEIQQAMALEWLEDWFGHLNGDDTDTAREVILTWLDEELRVVRTRTSPTGTLWLLTGLPDPEDTVQARVRARLVAAGVDPAVR